MELVAEDGRRVPLEGEVVIGRAPGSTLLLDDPTISRTHARVSPDGVLRDAGSSHGTWLDGARVTGPLPLRPGARIQVGNLVLRVEGEPPALEGGGAGTIVMPAVAADPLAALATQVGLRPALRAGVRIKQLPADEGAMWLVHDPDRHEFVRVEPGPGALLARLDGTHALTDLVEVAGPDALGRLARLLAELGERGLLVGVPGARPPLGARPPGWRGWLLPRERSFPTVTGWLSALHRRGGWLLLTPPALLLLALVAVAGLAAEVALIVGRYGTPFVVASHLGVGGLVFLASRFTLVALHESAHALVLGGYGRPVRRAGLRLLVVLPYAWVDTSESLWEPRRRRMAVAAAGPASDLVLGGAFALACLTLPAGTVRDVCFQVAFAAYVGAVFNLNPFLDRDGYALISDRLGVVGLKKRARAQLVRRLGGKGRPDDDPVLGRYAVATLGWMVLAVGLGVLMSLRFEPVMERYASPTVVWTGLVTAWLAMLAPVLWTVGKPLAGRRGL